MSKVCKVTSNNSNSNSNSNSNNNNDKMNQMSSTALPLLPNEVLSRIVTFMDIPSLSNVAVAVRPTPDGMFGKMCNDDATWTFLVRRRFRIDCTHKKPKTFGGLDWKMVYKNLMRTCRMPKCKVTQQKVQFAKPCKLWKPKATAKGNGNGNGAVPNGVALWVSIGHTDDCQLRRFRRQSHMPLSNLSTRTVPSESLSTSTSTSTSTVTNTDRYSYNANTDTGTDTGTGTDHTNGTNNTRYIELHLCLQNTKSTMTCVSVDLANASVQMATDNGSRILRVPVLPFSTRILFDSHGTDSNTADDTNTVNDTDTDTDTDTVPTNTSQCVSLRPFQFVVVAVHVPCTSEMRYETDFLARSLSFDVPVTLRHPPTHHVNVNVNVNVTTTTAMVSSSFLSEKEVWNHYMELPGNCLALTQNNYIMS